MNISEIFSKLIALFMFALSFIVPGAPDNVEINVNVNDTPSQCISVEWKNSTGKAITEPRFFMEKEENGEWERITFSQGFGFREIYTEYYPTEKGSFGIDSEIAFGEKLSPGNYRLTLYYDVINCTPDKGSSAIEFTVS